VWTWVVAAIITLGGMVGCTIIYMWGWGGSLAVLLLVPALTLYPPYLAVSLWLESRTAGLIASAVTYALLVPTIGHLW
jgi:hypothetical protein